MPLLTAGTQEYSTPCHLAKDVSQSQLRSSNEQRKINRESDEPRASYSIGGANSEESKREAPKACRPRPFLLLPQRKSLHLPLSPYGKEGNVFIKY